MIGKHHFVVTRCFSSSSISYSDCVLLLDCFSSSSISSNDCVLLLDSLIGVIVNVGGNIWVSHRCFILYICIYKAIHTVVLEWCLD